MEAKLKNIGEVTIINIKGALDIEKTQPFRDHVVKHFATQKLIFNMQYTTFVGSTGIQPFLDAVQILTQKNSNGIKLVGLGIEFKRIFQNMEIANLEIHDTEESAVASFIGPIASAS